MTLLYCKALLSTGGAIVTSDDDDDDDDDGDDDNVDRISSEWDDSHAWNERVARDQGSWVNQTMSTRVL